MQPAAFAYLVGHVHRKYAESARQLLVKCLYMKLDPDLIMYFNQAEYIKVFHDRSKKNEPELIVGDVVLLRQIPRLQCRQPDERFEVIETLFSAGRHLDPLSGLKYTSTVPGKN
ncbi:hypothetical protein ACOME3_010244 [Neoechinorhynchus agilis]